MKCPTLSELPQPSTDKKGWPWVEESSPFCECRSTHIVWPRVSIVTPCFNSGLYLEECIRSVLLQGYPDLEYIIMDGGSSDDSVEIIKKYEKWLAYWESLPDHGQSHAINKGLAKCTGTYFNWHNADDILLPGSLFQTVEGFHKHPDAGYISRTRLLLEGGRVYPKTNAPLPGLINLERSIITTCPGSQPGGLLDRSLVVRVGKLDEGLHCSMDEDLMLRMRLEAPGYYIENPGFIFRIHKDQKSRALTRIRVKEKFIISRKIFAGLRKDDPLRGLEIDARIFAHRHGAGLHRASNHLFPALWHSFLAKFLLIKKFFLPQTGQKGMTCS